jgi:hypothetical protein
MQDGAIEAVLAASAAAWIEAHLRELLRNSADVLQDGPALPAGCAGDAAAPGGSGTG